MVYISYPLKGPPGVPCKSWQVYSPLVYDDSSYQSNYPFA